jgi:hypothetical protein
MADQTVRFIAKRQATLDAKSHWEGFDLRFRPVDMNVIIALRDITGKPVDRFGNPTSARGLRFQLSGGGVRVLCNAGQW